MIGIVAALQEEVDMVSGFMTDVTSFDKARSTFVSGKINNVDVTLVRCGVGKVNAAICTQILIDCYGVDVVINVGVAGGLAKGLELGDIILSKDTMQYDMDATLSGCEPGEIPNMGGKKIFTADEKWLNLAKSAASALG